MMAFLEILVEGFRLVEVFAIFSADLVRVQMLVRIPSRAVKECRVLHEPRHSCEEPIRGSYFRTTCLILVIFVKID